MKDKPILIVDDEPDLLAMVRSIFERAGFTQIITASSGEAALDECSKKEPAMAILDVMMPDMDGFELLREIRQTSEIPVLMLTAKGEAEDRCRGLELGADDYVTKPFPISVFRKKVSALLDRIRKQTGGDCYTDGTLSINFSELTAALAGDPVIFTPMEYRLLKVLVRNPQIVLTRQVLLEKLWDADENFVDEHALTVAVSRIRGKIEVDSLQYIKTVYGMGYMWIGGIKK